MFKHTEASVRWFYFEKSQENSCGGLSFLIKWQTPPHVFSCEFCKIKNIYFAEKLRTAASEHRIYIFFFVFILPKTDICRLILITYSVSNVQSYGVGANPVKLPTSDLVIFFIFYLFEFGFKEFIHCWLINTKNYDNGWPLKLTFGMNRQLNMHMGWRLKVMLGSHCIVYIFVRILI